MAEDEGNKEDAGEKVPEATSYKKEVLKKSEEPSFKIQINVEIPTLSDVPEDQVDIRYPVIPPYSYIHIYWEKETSELVYEVEEPKLSPEEKENLSILEEGVSELINLSYIGVRSQKETIVYLEKNLRILVDELSLKISKDSFLKIMYYIYRDFVGLNEIEPLMQDYFIEDIECNGVNTPLYIVHRKYRNLRTNVIYKDINNLTSFVEKLAQKAGKYISFANPLLDGRLPDGSRVNSTYTQDISSKGPTFTIRKFVTVPWTPVKLIETGSVSPEILAYLWIAIEYERNIMMVGGTGTGKTSFLNSIAFFIPPQARIVSIEDSVTGDSEIIIDDKGIIKKMTMKEFYDCYRDNLGIKVLTLDNNFRLKFTNPSKIYEHKTNKDIYEITTSTGRRIKVTKDHSLFTLGNKELVEAKPQDLAVNKSFIAVPRKLPQFGNGIKKINLLDFLDVFQEDFLVGEPIKKIFFQYKYKDLKVTKSCYQWWKSHNLIKIKKFKELNFKFSNEELKSLKIKSKNKSRLPVLFEINNTFLEFLGLWIGDGSYDNYNANRVIISNIDRECIDVARKVAKKLNINISNMSDNVSLTLNSTIFYKFMKKVLCFDGYSHSKRIPNTIFNLSDEQLKSFIRGYYSADGTVQKNDVSCTSKSRGLLTDLQTLFLRLDTIARISHSLRKDKCNSLFISSFDHLSRFKEIGFLQKRKNEKLNMLGNIKAHHAHSDVIPLSVPQLKEISANHTKLSWPYLQGMQNIGRDYLQKIAPTGSFYNDVSHSDLLWDRVLKIKKMKSKERYVYDISIPETEKFVSSNIILHNTKELNLLHENWLPSVARQGIGLANILGQRHGEVSLFLLLKESFRQRPDYVIVGEVRGEEAYVLFQGMASIRGNEKIMVLNHDKPKRIPIKDMKEDIKYKAITYNLDKNKAEILPVKFRVIHPKRDKLYKIKTKKGREIVVTADHSLFTYEKEVLPIEAKKLRKGDKIMIPSKIPCGYADMDYIDFTKFLPGIRVFSPELVKKATRVLGYEAASKVCNIKSISDYYANFKKSKPSSLKSDQFFKLMKESKINYSLDKLKLKFTKNSKEIPAKFKLSNEFLRLLGYYLSDGSLNTFTGSMAFYNKNEEILTDIRRCIDKLDLGIKPSLRTTKGFGSCEELAFRHMVLFKFIKQYCGTKKDKHAPEFIFGLSKEKIGQFLTGLYNGDGSFISHFNYYTISKKLADDVAHLLLVYGIVPTILTRKRSHRKNIDYEVLFYSRKEKEEFLKYIKPTGKKVNLGNPGKLNKKFIGDLYIDSIKEVEEVKLKKPEPVYDVSIPGNRNFIGKKKI